MDSFSHLSLLFVIYAVIGWLWETFYCSLKAKKFQYRGFLMGPYCPIYGFGVVGVLYLLRNYHQDLILLFIYATIIVTVLEFLTSYVLEKVFHTTWWDYQGVPFNIQGRVALPVSLFWGLACVVIVRFVQPEIMKLVNALLNTFGNWLPGILLLLMLADFVYTVASLLSFEKVVDKWSQALAEGKADLQAKKEDWEEELAEQRASFANFKEEHKLPSIQFNHRRLLHNFERIKIKGVENLPELKSILKKRRGENKK